MKRLLVSRALPDSVMQVLQAEYDVTLRPTTQPMSEDEASA
ncbi:MAG TPA: D-glycerate dehydrogenase, partial [Rhodobacteraceae bacterium]|nr:D-glycerate dehydrogenase [Paracoccaceae bacterium]